MGGEGRCITDCSGLVPEICKTRNEVLCMIANAILASARPEVDNIRVVAKRQDSSLRQTLGQERLWPDDLFLRPRLLAMPGQAMDEDKTVNEPDSVRDT